MTRTEYERALRGNTSLSTAEIAEIYGKIKKETDTRNLGYLRRLVAMHPDTPPHILEELSSFEDMYWDVQSEVARNPNTPPHILSTMADSEIPVIYQAVMENPSLPAEKIEEIVHGEDEDKRELLSFNRGISIQAIQALYTTGNEYIWSGIAGHEYTPAVMLRQLAEKGLHQVDVELANNSALPEEVMKILSDSSSSWARAELANHPWLPDYLIEKLLSDKEFSVRAAAQQNPRYRESIETKYTALIDQLVNKVPEQEMTIIWEIVKNKTLGR